MSLNYVQGLTMYQAGSGSIIGATSIVLTTLTDIYGNVLTMVDFGSKGFGTLEPDTTNEEAFTFTGITPNANGTYTLTGVSTSLAKSPYTESSGLVRSHSGGTKVVFSDSVAFWNTFGNKNNDETILGNWQVPAGTPSSTNSIAGKAWVLSVVNGGAVSVDSLIPVATAGETVAAGNVVYLKAADGRWWLAKANDNTKVYGVMLGIAQGSGTAGNAVTGGVLNFGLDTNQSGLVAGTTYYVSDTGTVSATAGTYPKIIGSGSQISTKLYFNPYVFTIAAPVAQTYAPTAAGTATLDLSLSPEHFITMPAGNITIALSNGTNNQVFYVSITQDNSGSRTVTWFGTIRWTGGTVPTLTTTASKRDAFIFVKTGATTYDGFVAGLNI